MVSESAALMKQVQLIRNIGVITTTIDENTGKIPVRCYLSQQ